MKGFCWTALLSVILLPVHLQAQGQPHNEIRTRLMWLPQYLFNNGMRFEVDKKLSDALWLVVSPTVYYKDNPDRWLYGFSNIHGRKGISVEAGLKWYPEQQVQQMNYLLVGGGFTISQRKRFGDRWQAYEDDGLLYYRYDESYWHTTTNALTLRLAAGRHLFQGEHFLVDAYLGLGIRFASTKRPQGFLYNDPEPTTLDHDYSGVIGVAGFRVGLQW